MAFLAFTTRFDVLANLLLFIFFMATFTLLMKLLALFLGAVTFPALLAARFVMTAFTAVQFGFLVDFF